MRIFATLMIALLALGCGEDSTSYDYPAFPAPTKRTPDPPRPDAAEADADNTPAEPMLNEVMVANSGGADTNEYVEIYGDPSHDYSDYTIVALEGDADAGGDGAGVIAEVPIVVGTTDANGFWVSALPSDGAFQNGSVTFLLVLGNTGVVDTDLDTDDNGVFDIDLPWTQIVDSVALEDVDTADIHYNGTDGPELELGTMADGDANPGGASRRVDGTDTDAAADWATNPQDGSNDGADTADATPGVANVIGS